MKTQVAIWAGKIIGVLSRALGHGGSTIPGIVARKLDAKFLRHSRSIAKTIFYITGTNGKTTTANLISHLLQTAGQSVMTNREGSNMVTGLSACLVQSAPLIGWKKYDVAVLEVDEASLPNAIAECPSDYLLITNFFRDQLDRYGEIDLLIKKMKDSLKYFAGNFIINADDPFSNRFSNLKKDNIYVGLNAHAYPFDSYLMTESRYCPNCQNELSYSSVHYGHLGHYHCTCGFKRPETTFAAEKVFNDKKGIRLVIDDEEYPTTFKGLYNAYNVLFAIQACQALDVKPDVLRKGLMTYQNSKGRMQEFLVNGKVWRLNLVKNPAGGNVTLSEYFEGDETKLLMFCLNDNLADGEDISWIWDIDMELANRDELELFIASGTRAHDAALRMKYTGFPEKKIIILPDMNEAVLYAKRFESPTYIMATYTCLSPMISILSKEAEKENKGDSNLETSTIPLLSRYTQSVWRQGKYYLLKKAMRMEGDFSTSRRNQKPK
ncbi:MAG: MurT ligase domain-containing protein [Bacillota bacterium]|nr:MurT ligase domain-containing protein [Bacillota bacterium]